MINLRPIPRKNRYLELVFILLRSPRVRVRVGHTASIPIYRDSSLLCRKFLHVFSH